MKHLLFYLLFLGSAVTAQPLPTEWSGFEFTPEVYFSEPGEDDVHLGSITHFNMNTAHEYPDQVVIDTPYGDVLVEVTHTINGECDVPCPDTITIYDLPEGIIAIPMEMVTPEGRFSEILLYRYTGS